MQAGIYWSGTVFAPNPIGVWYFGAFNGFQDAVSQNNPLLAVAVRPGDVIAAIPEPQTYAMMLLGLSALMVAVRRRSR